MTDNERLEKLKERFRKAIIYFGRYGGNVSLLEELMWLIQKAELVEELKKQNRTLNKKNARLLKVNAEIIAERDELRRRYESNRQTYINVQKGRADKRRKGRG